MIVKNDKSSFESYLVDAANIKGDCEKVFFPENHNELLEVIKDAGDNNQTMTISASRTGLNCGSVPSKGILISTEKLNRIVKIDELNKLAIVEPGLRLKDLQNELDKYELFYPPDPTETNCSLGGTVANNASGARTFKYGPTRNYVEAIKVILSDGYEFEIERGNFVSKGLLFDIKTHGRGFQFALPDYVMPNVKHSAGYYSKPDMDLIDLFIGSEGTLGVISELKLKLIKKPEAVLSMIIFFEEENNLFSFVREIRNNSRDKKNILDLREIEYFDKNSLKVLLEDYSNIPENAEGAVWIEQEIRTEDEERYLNKINNLIQNYKGGTENLWFAFDDRERIKLQEFRHNIALKVDDIISSRGLVKVGTDTAVPDSIFQEFYEFTTEMIEAHNIDYVAYGHIGNSHLHFNMLPKTPHELELCKTLYGSICSKSTELGGTISAEHGIGKLKTKYLVDMFGEKNIIKMAKLKKIFDPQLYLNIGNMIDIKYLDVA